jgi:hypothetical protein
MGLVNRVLPDAELDEYVRQIATSSHKCTAVDRRSKQIINAVIRAQGDFSKSEEAIARCMHSEDYVEGRRRSWKSGRRSFRGVEQAKTYASAGARNKNHTHRFVRAQWRRRSRLDDKVQRVTIRSAQELGPAGSHGFGW